MAQILFNFISPIRWIFMAIDSILFGLVDNCYQLIVSFANAELFTSDQISEIRTKIYFIITLVAFFRLAFLLINSLINPDKLTDESEGLSKIAFNFVIMLILLVVTPIIFNIALDLQKDIVNENVITGIFTLAKEDGYTCTVDQSDLNKIKRENYKKYNAQTKSWVIDEEKYQQDIEYKKSALCSSAEMKAIVVGSLIYPDTRIARESGGEYEVINSSACDGKCEKAITDYNTMLKERNFKFTTLEKYIGVTVEIDDSDVFVYNYTLVITTICVGFMLYILLSFAFDLGKRLLEMNLLMILSPLFIATYVDPKSAKSGPFNNWLKAMGNTYAGLFLRLAALAVMMLFVKIISINKAGLEPIGPIGFIILLFAGLTFCKELPKWISGLLGMKEGGMGELGLGKKLGATPLLGGAAKKAGYLAAGTAGAAAAGGWNALKDRSKRRGEKGLGYFRNRSGIDGVTEGLTGKERRQALRDARRGAYARDGKPENGGFFKQVGAGMLGSAIAGGRQAIKADNVKGAFQGSIKAADSFGKSVGNKGGTVSEWVDDKLLGVTTFATGLYGSPSDLYNAREEIENNKKAATVVRGGRAGKYSADKEELSEGEVAVGKKAQEKIQMHGASKTRAITHDPKTGKEVVLPLSEQSETTKFAASKAYQAATFAFGESKVTGVTIDGKDIKVSIAGMSSPLTVSVDDAAKGKFGDQFGKAASFGEGAEGEKIYSTTYYESQQTTLQNREKYEESDRRLGESIATLTASITDLKKQFSSNGHGNFDDIMSGLTAAQKKSTASIIDAIKQKGAAEGWSQEAINEAVYIASQQGREQSLKDEKAKVALKIEETSEYIATIIDGSDLNDKMVQVEKSVSKAKGLGISTSDDDKK